MMIAASPGKEDEAGIGVEGRAPNWGGRHVDASTWRRVSCIWRLEAMASGSEGTPGRRRKGGKHDRSKTPGRPGQGANLGPALHRSDLFCLM